MTRLTVDEAAATYESAMRNIPAARPGICAICRTFIDPSYAVCWPCLNQPSELDVVLPITYSEDGGQVHHALRRYKDGLLPERRYIMPRLAGILWRFIDRHEHCLAVAAGVQTGFQLVTTVPSSTPERDERRGNLRTIVEWCAPVSERFERVLRATGQVPKGREYDTRRYTTTRPLDGDDVLLVDDTWTGGGHAQSAAHALRSAGARSIGLLVLGRHLRPDWEVTAGVTCADLYAQLPKRFDWSTCAVHD